MKDGVRSPLCGKVQEIYGEFSGIGREKAFLLVICGHNLGTDACLPRSTPPRF